MASGQLVSHGPVAVCATQAEAPESASAGTQPAAFADALFASCAPSASVDVVPTRPSGCMTALTYAVEALYRTSAAASGEGGEAAAAEARDGGAAEPPAPCAAPAPPRPKGGGFKRVEPPPPAFAVRAHACVRAAPRAARVRPRAAPAAAEFWNPTRAAERSTRLLSWGGCGAVRAARPTRAPRRAQGSRACLPRPLRRAAPRAQICSDSGAFQRRLASYASSVHSQWWAEQPPAVGVVACARKGWTHSAEALGLTATCVECGARRQPAVTMYGQETAAEVRGAHRAF
jgi:hypothetical protein